ncbi:MAG: hypothetical protein KBT06_06230 [Prevotellaceae bacterium]|nr:hypothetical protein [Candidatus Colivivens equi]
MKRILFIAILIATMLPSLAEETLDSVKTATTADTVVSAKSPQKKSKPAKISVSINKKGIKAQVDNVNPDTVKEIVEEAVASIDTTVESTEIFDDEDEFEEKEEGCDRHGPFWNVFDFSEDTLTEILAIICIFIILPGITMVLLPILILWLILKYKRNKQHEKNELIKILAENGQDVSSFFNKETTQKVVYRTTNSKQEKTSTKIIIDNVQYDKGITNTIIGGIITLVCVAYNWPSIFVIGGLILLGYGISQILKSKRTKDSISDAEVNSNHTPDNNEPEKTQDSTVNNSTN